MGKPAAQDQAQDQAQAKPAKERHGRFMKRIDTNEDGQISGDEFAAAGERMFARLDDNGDGKIAKEEVPQHRKHKPGDQTGDQPTDQPTEQPAP
jgi:Ca2+-binding EF-hand superfamily protein